MSSLSSVDIFSNNEIRRSFLHEQKSELGYLEDYQTDLIVIRTSNKVDEEKRKEELKNITQKIQEKRILIINIIAVITNQTK